MKRASKGAKPVKPAEDVEVDPFDENDPIWKLRDALSDYAVSAGNGSDAADWDEAAELPSAILREVLDAGIWIEGCTAEDILTFADPRRAMRRQLEKRAWATEAAKLSASHKKHGIQLAAGNCLRTVEILSYSKAAIDAADRLAREWERDDGAIDYTVQALRWLARDAGVTRSRGKGRRTLELEKAILDVLDAFDVSMSSRQIFYQVVSSGAVENNRKETARVLRTVLALRREGRIAYSRIVDRTRRKHHLDGWDSMTELLDSAQSQYRRSLWTDATTIPMIACEKQALEGVFSSAVDEWGVSLWTLRGFASESFAWEWAEEILELNRWGRAVEVTYFGDFDPSGMAIEADIRSKLEGFGAVFEWNRGGLLFEDFKAFRLIDVPLKKTDSRAKSFLSKFGRRAAELDALPPDELARRIDAVIEKHLDRDTVKRTRKVEAAERESLQLVANNFDKAVAAIRGAA